MRTSLNEIAAIEQQLLHTTAPDEQLLFEAKLLLDEDLRQKTAAQRQAYQLIQQYGRQQLRAELENVYQILMHTPQHLSYAQRIKRIFGFI
jgi:DNA-binding transcriptional regulator YbjK